MQLVQRRSEPGPKLVQNWSNSDREESDLDLERDGTSDTTYTLTLKSNESSPHSRPGFRFQPIFTVLTWELADIM